MKLHPAQAEARIRLGNQYRDHGLDPEKLAADLGTTTEALRSFYARRKMWKLAYYVAGPEPLTGQCVDCGGPMRATSTRCVHCSGAHNLAGSPSTAEKAHEASRAAAAKRAADRIAIVQELHDIGRTPHDAIAAAGVNGPALERWLYRRGLPELALWVHGAGRRAA